jgi:hypothetical protein
MYKAGSKDGSVRLWKCSADYKKLEPICAIPIVSYLSYYLF